MFRLGVILMLMLCAAPAAWAQSVVALVQTTNGVTGLRPMTQLFAGRTIDLGGGSLTFLHFGSCRSIAAQGGALTVDTDGYRLDGGKVLSEQAQTCPQKVRLQQASAGPPAGIVLRGRPPVQQASVQLGAGTPIVFAGAGAAAVSGLAILEGGREIAKLGVELGAAVWPASARLETGHSYVLRVDRKGQPALQLPVEAVPTTATPTVLDLE